MRHWPEQRAKWIVEVAGKFCFPCNKVHLQVESISDLLTSCGAQSSLAAFMCEPCCLSGTSCMLLLLVLVRLQSVWWASQAHSTNIFIKIFDVKKFALHPVATSTRPKANTATKVATFCLRDIIFYFIMAAVAATVSWLTGCLVLFVYHLAAGWVCSSALVGSQGGVEMKFIRLE